MKKCMLVRPGSCQCFFCKNEHYSVWVDGCEGCGGVGVHLAYATHIHQRQRERGRRREREKKKRLKDRQTDREIERQNTQTH